MARILISKKNLFHNLDIISKQAGGKEKVCVVLKNNAYGHGLKEVATLACEYGVKKAAVKSLNEALQIEEYFDEILVLTEEIFHTYSHTFHIALNSLEKISNLKSNCNVHIKVDTGMHRNGISMNDIEACIDGLYKRNINITGVFTHHRSADCLSTDFFWQNKNFQEVKTRVLKRCEQLLLPTPKFHSCNSAALFRHQNFDEDFARVGIATYGYIDTEKPLFIPPLKPVLSLWANRITTREIKQNQAIGYGGVYKAKKDMTVSTYNVGYGDGFLRLNERKKYTTPDGYDVLGRVSMDCLSLNTSKDEVCIFNDATSLAKIHDTITYEIVTSLNPYIKREIIR
ncbi:MAG: alanine racemase [Campylobacterota bacterium]